MESAPQLRARAAEMRRHADLLGDEQARAELIALAQQLDERAEWLERQSDLPRSKH